MTQVTSFADSSIAACTLHDDWMALTLQPREWCGNLQETGSWEFGVEHMADFAKDLRPRYAYLMRDNIIWSLTEARYDNPI